MQCNHLLASVIMKGALLGPMHNVREQIDLSRSKPTLTVDWSSVPTMEPSATSLPESSAAFEFISAVTYRRSKVFPHSPTAQDVFRSERIKELFDYNKFLILVAFLNLECNLVVFWQSVGTPTDEPPSPLHWESPKNSHHARNQKNLNLVTPTVFFKKKRPNRTILFILFFHKLQCPPKVYFLTFIVSVTTDIDIDNFTSYSRVWRQAPSGILASSFARTFRFILFQSFRLFRLSLSKSSPSLMGWID